MSNDNLIIPFADRARAQDFSSLIGILPNPDPILRKEGKSIAVYRDLRSDAHVGGCIRRRKAALKALEWGLNQGKAAARVFKGVQDILSNIDMERLIGDIAEAPLYGYQPLEVMWEYQGGWLVPVDVRLLPNEWFGFTPEGELRFKSRFAPVEGEPVPEMKVLCPRNEGTFANPYGQSELALCFWPIVFKKGGVKFWVRFVEKWGSPFLIGTYAPGATEEELDRLEAGLSQMIEDATAVIPENSTIKPLEAAGKSASADLYEKLVMWARSEVSIALTGTNQTVEANSNRASATAGLQVADDLRDADAEIVKSTVNQLVKWIVKLNFGDVPVPEWGMWDQTSRDGVKVARDKTAYDAGARFTKQYWQREYGYQEGDLQEMGIPQPIPSANTRLASHAQQATAPDYAAVQADRLVSDGEPSLKNWLDTVKSMLASASSLEEFSAMLESAFPQLDSAMMSQLLGNGLMAGELAGRFAATQDAVK